MKTKFSKYESSANQFQSYIYLIFLNLVDSTFRIASFSTLDFGHNCLFARVFYINFDSSPGLSSLLWNTNMWFCHISFHCFKDDISAFDFFPPSIKILFLFLTSFLLSLNVLLFSFITVLGGLVIVIVKLKCVCTVCIKHAFKNKNKFTAR